MHNIPIPVFYSYSWTADKEAQEERDTADKSHTYFVTGS